MAKKELWIMFKRKRKNKHIPGTNIHQLTTMDLVRQFLISRLPVQKQKLDNKSLFEPPPPPPSEEIGYLAIVLDGVVEDVMRAQPRLVALLLSNPEFVEFDPEKDRPQIGQTKYQNGTFIYKEEDSVEE